MQKHSDGGEAARNEVVVAPFSGIYYGPLLPLKPKEAHQTLLAAIEGRTGAELFTATAYDQASGAPCACFDIAIDPRSSDGCGIFRTIIVEAGGGEPHDIATPALWYQYEKPEDIVAKVYRHLDGMNFFANFYDYIEAAVRQSGEAAKRQVH